MFEIEMRLSDASIFENEIKLAETRRKDLVSVAKLFEKFEDYYKNEETHIQRKKEEQIANHAG